MTRDPHVFVILGGTGDLAATKLLPALHRVCTDGSPIVGVGTTAHDDASYREWVVERLEAAGESVDAGWVECLHYHRLEGDGFELGDLATRIDQLEGAHAGNRVVYLALPPQLFPDAIRALGAVGLSKSEGWTRLVVEKPFGTDAASATELDRVIHDCFDEDSVFRIDHFLGKETVRNLLAFRFANPIFETTWHRDRIAKVEITVAETVGVGSRSRYYDRSGVVRDMVQNHLTQVLALVAMEPPVRLDATAIRDEKVKVLRAVDTVDTITFARYEAGHVDGGQVLGYLEELGVPPDSTTATFVEATLHVDTWRWQGVPFILRTGKRLPVRESTVDIHFRHPPVHLFKGPHGGPDPRGNLLRITLQPDEGFDLAFEVKRPGNGMDLARMELGFRYDEVFGPLPDAYDTLIADIIAGDQTLFVRSDEVAESWRVWDPVADPAEAPVGHPAGTWPEGTGPPG